MRVQAFFRLLVIIVVFSHVAKCQVYLGPKLLTTGSYRSLGGEFLLALPDTGLLVVGSSLMTYGMVSRIDKDRNVVWTFEYVWKKSPFITEFMDGAVLRDGSIVLAAYTQSATGSPEGFVLRIGKSGKVLWSNAITGSVGEGFVPFSVTATSDSGFVVSGTSGTAAMLKFGKDNSVQLTRKFSAPFMNAISIKETSDSGYICCGEYSSNMTQPLIMKLDRQLDTVWSKRVFCEDNLRYYATDIVQLDSTFAFSVDGKKHVVAICDMYGKIISAQEYKFQNYPNDNSWKQYERAHRLRKVSGNRLIVTNKVNGYTDRIVIATDHNAIPLWAQSSRFEKADIVELSDKRFATMLNPPSILFRHSQPYYDKDIGLEYSDSAGYSNVCISKSLPVSYSIACNSLMTSIPYTHESTAYLIYVDTNIVHVSGDSKCIDIGGNLIENMTAAIKVYPNPSSGKCYLSCDDASLHEVTFELTDITGRVILTRQIDCDAKETVLHGIRPAVYLYRIRDDQTMIRMGKLVILDE